MDVFLEAGELTPNLRQLIREVAWEVSLEEGVVITTLVATSQELVNSPLAVNPIMQASRNEGVEVYRNS